MKLKLGEKVVTLPAGFIKIPDHFTRKEVRDYVAENGFDRRIVKHFATKVESVVLFDPESADYQDLLKDYKEDDRALGKAIQKIIDEAGLPIWTRKTRQPSSRKKHQRVRFMLKPVFTASSRKNKSENTLNWGYRRDLFTLHFDDEHNLQLIRFWDSKKMPPHISDRRNKVNDQLLQESEALKENYGNWDAMAKIIFPIIKEVYGENVEQLQETDNTPSTKGKEL